MWRWDKSFNEEKVERIRRGENKKRRVDKSGRENEVEKSRVETRKRGMVGLIKVEEGMRWRKKSRKERVETNVAKKV